jgi:tRNA (guanine37-N1)-methyltransferase
LVLKFTVITLFPDLISAWAQTGLIGTAIKKNLLQIEIVNPRDFTSDVHHSVDDKAFGGSDGMVMKFEPLAKAIESAAGAHVAFLSPQGARWEQSKAEAWASSKKHVVLVCGRYAGFDQRLIETFADEEVSVGDYILNGGEVASLSVMESVARLIPGVLGNEISGTKESFQSGLLEAPAFTRPRDVGGLSVPSALLSGNHKQIERFERDVSLLRTKLLRPDLFKNRHEQECREALGRLKKLPPAELTSLGLSAQQLSGLE